MKKAILDIKRLNSNDVVATSSAPCTADLSIYESLFQSNGTNDGFSLYTKDNTYYSYDSEKKSFTKNIGDKVSFYNLPNPAEVTDGKWYHIHYVYGYSTYVKCTNPASHNLPKDRE